MHILLRVAHLVEEAVQAQVDHQVLMNENRRDVHRDPKAGPDFGSVVYGTIPTALAVPPAYDPPAEAPPAYGPPA
ncbi:hypothetical protein WJX82_008252 [Trebouxia sp. C0006]